MRDRPRNWLLIAISFVFLVSLAPGCGGGGGDNIVTYEGYTPDTEDLSRLVAQRIADSSALYEITRSGSTDLLGTTFSNPTLWTGRSVGNTVPFSISGDSLAGCTANGEISFEVLSTKYEISSSSSGNSYGETASLESDSGTIIYSDCSGGRQDMTLSYTDLKLAFSSQTVLYNNASTYKIAVTLIGTRNIGSSDMNIKINNVYYFSDYETATQSQYVNTVAWYLPSDGGSITRVIYTEYQWMERQYDNGASFTTNSYTVNDNDNDCDLNVYCRFTHQLRVFDADGSSNPYSPYRSYSLSTQVAEVSGEYSYDLQGQTTNSKQYPNELRFDLDFSDTDYTATFFIDDDYSGSGSLSDGSGSNMVSWSWTDLTSVNMIFADGGTETYSTIVLW